MDFKISQDDAQDILNYLVSKPWSEVNELISKLKAIQPIKDD